MAVGDVTEERYEGRGGEHVIAASNQTTTGNGTWLDVRHYKKMSVQIRGITSGTVVTNISNRASKPANSVHDAQASSITADAMVSVEYPVRWLKVRVTGASDVDVYADLFGAY